VSPKQNGIWILLRRGDRNFLWLQGAQISMMQLFNAAVGARSRYQNGLKPKKFQAKAIGRVAKLVNSVELSTPYAINAQIRAMLVMPTEISRGVAIL